MTKTVSSKFISSDMTTDAELAVVQGQVDKVNSAFYDQKEPNGFVDRTQSTLTFNESTRTLTIAPVSTSYDVYIRGVKVTISQSLSLQIPDTTGTYFFYIDANGTLNYMTTFDVSFLTTLAYTAYVYFNAESQKVVSFGEERHGISMDGATHSYLHTSRGTQLISGASIGFTLNTTPSISISDARVSDEDISVNIANSASPSANHQQILSPVAYIPVYYKSGTKWTKDTATAYPLKQGTVRPQYNSVSGSTWGLTEASADGKYLASYIFATTHINEPIIALLGQAEYTDLADAEANAAWSKISFGDLPSQEMKLLHTVIFEASSAHAAPYAVIKSVKDLRFGADREVSAYSTNTAHSNLSGLSNDDHLQYHTDTRGDARYYTKTQTDTFLSGKQATGNYITALTGDVAATGPGSVAAALSNTGVTAGTYNNVTVDAKGRVTAGSVSNAITRYSYSTTTTNSTTLATYSSIGQLTSVSLIAGLYRFKFTGLAQSANAQTGVGFRFGAGTAVLGSTYGKFFISQSANGISQSFTYDQLAATTDITSASVPTVNTNFVVDAEGVFRVSTAGTVAIQFRSETAGTAITLATDASFTIELV